MERKEEVEPAVAVLLSPGGGGVGFSGSLSPAESAAASSQPEVRQKADIAARAAGCPAAAAAC